MIERFKLTEIGELPIDWDVASFKDVSSMKSGLSITSKKISDVGLFPCYGGNGLRGFTSTYTHDGDYALIGRQGALCGNIQFASNKFFASEHAVVVTPKKNINIKWLSYVLGRMNLNQYSESSAQPGLSVKKILQLPIPLPPTKAEQTAIAIALGDADDLITSLERLIVKKKAIKQGAIYTLLTPKKDWRWVTLNQIGKTYGGLSGKTKSDFNGGSFPYIPFMNIMNNTVIDPSFLDFVNINPWEKQNKVIPGDLLFNGSSETPEEVGMCSVLMNPLSNLYLNSFCFGYRLLNEKEFYNLYLAYYFRSNYGRKLLYNLAQGATRHNLSKSNFLRLEFQVPAYQEQKSITEILSDMDAEITLLEKKLEKQKLIKQGMMQVLLTGKVRLL